MVKKVTKLKTRPTLKERKRYIFFYIHTNRPLLFTEVKNAVEDALLNWMGIEKYARAKPWLIKNLWDGKMCVIRCNHKYVDDVKMSLALINQIGDAKVIFQGLRVSGTLKSGKEKLNKLE
jgi:RNase P/RNase MRP subunit POP5